MFLSAVSVLVEIPEGHMNNPVFADNRCRRARIVDDLFYNSTFITFQVIVGQNIAAAWRVIRNINNMGL